MKAGDTYRDSQGDTWTVQDDGTLMWDESATYDEPLFHSLADLEVGYGPIRPVSHGVEARIWCDRNGEVWKVAHDGSLHPLDVDLDELDVNPHEVDDPQIGHGAARRWCDRNGDMWNVEQDGSLTQIVECHDHDPVNHPRHYTGHPSGIECIQVTEHMNFNLGNATKYLWRAGEKGDAVEDLRKSVWYIEREIARLGAVS